MTAETKKSEEFRNFMSIEKELSELSEQRKDSRPNKRDEASDKLKKRAYETLQEVGEFGGINYRNKALEDLDENDEKVGINLRLGMANEGSSLLLNSNLDDIVHDVPKESLESIALTKPLVEKGSQNYTELLKYFSEYFGAKELLEKYKKGQLNDPKELEFIRSHAAKIAGNKIAEKMKEKGYSKDLQNMGRNLAALAARESGLFKEDEIKKGAEDYVKESEKKFREYEGKAEKKVVDYVTSTLRELAKGSGEEFEAARQLVYMAMKKE